MHRVSGGEPEIWVATENASVAAHGRYFRARSKNSRKRPRLREEAASVESVHPLQARSGTERRRFDDEEHIALEYPRRFHDESVWTNEGSNLAGGRERQLAMKSKD